MSDQNQKIGNDLTDNNDCKNEPSDISPNNNKNLQRSSDPSHNKLLFRNKKLRITSAPVGDLKKLPFQGNKIIKKGPLLKLSGGNRFKKWRWKMCYVEDNYFSYHPIDKSSSLRNTIDLSTVNPFTLPSNDPKSKKLIKHGSKLNINWNEVLILYFMPIDNDQGKIRYFAINNDQLDEWIMSINLAKQNSMNVQFKKQVNFENETSISNDKKISMKDNSNNKETETNDNNNNISYVGELESTKEIPFTQLSSSDDELANSKRYTLAALRRSNILDFEFDS